ncbi:MAG: DUF3093 domain-containing protein [Jatrophihabitantaceae bacterium]
MDASSDASHEVVYRESLRTPWWWYVVGLIVAGLLAAEFHISSINLTDWLSFGIMLPLSVVIVWSLGRGALEISDGELRIRGAHIPLHEFTGAVALDAETLRRVVGREGDPAAFISIRGWIGPGVQLWLDDAEDPTPYWVVSSRHPQRVVDLVRAAV